MKPNWKDAPEWANYRAMDSDGLWVWYEIKPYQTINSVGMDVWESDGGKRQIASHFSWKETLEERPE